jgi:phosphoribosylformimino-5-aminoimidazole carboxamide ribotide isomerase
MIVYPAIDIMGGQCVRLKRGDFADATRYSARPIEALEIFAQAGAQWAHVVDLDGARGGAPIQHDLLASLAGQSPLFLQVAGGFRTIEQVASMIAAGASRVVVGSLAVEQPEQVDKMIEEFGSEAIAIALDVRLVDGVPMVAHRGWTEISDSTLAELAARFPAARHILVTDIARDGMQRGANIELMCALAEEFPRLCMQASGGVARVGELETLKQAGTAGVIIGKAIWEGKIELKEALRLARA